MSRTRISTQLTIGLGLVGVAGFGGYGVFQAVTETRHLKRSIEREMELVVKSVQVGVENALRDRQMADIQETLERLEAIDPRIDILVFDREANFKAGSGDPDRDRDRLRAAGRQALAASQIVFDWEPASSPTEIMASLPLRDDDETLQGSLVVTRPLADLAAAVARAQRNIAVAALLFVAVMAVVGYSLSSLLVRRPLAVLVAAIRRLRSEGTAEPVSTDAGAEIVELVDEFNALLADLKGTRTRLDQESESRLRLEEGLRRVDKLVTVGQLSAGLAHEIGSPLQILSGRAQALGARANDPTAVRKNAAIMVEECDRIANIIQQLLTFARRRPPAMNPIDLSATVATVVDLLSVEAKRRGVHLSVSRAAGDVRVFGDNEQLQQVVINLLSNAFNATPTGGEVALQVEGGRAADPTAPAHRNWARITVTDTGKGMTAETLAQLFEPFFTTRTDEGGTGLGLAVVKAIVNDHGGRVSARSELGLGSQFVVELPECGSASGADA